MNTSIIAVGTELLFGQTVNTNAAYLSENLNHLGFNVMYHFVVGDNDGRLEHTLKRALTDTDLVIVTGGLGPTQDDMTKETVARVMDAPLYLNEECLAEIKRYFSIRNREMAPNNVQQAYIPENAVTFRNEAGTAPAFAVNKGDKWVICYPGPPRELKWIFEDSGKDFLRKFKEKQIYYRVIRTIGIGESDLETLLMPLIDNQTDPTIATYAKEGECTIRVASQRDTMEEAQAAVENMISRMNNLIGSYIYSYDDEELKAVVVHKLQRQGLTISSAESCTGGAFAASITDVPGASKVLSRGYITYDEEAKISMLGVDPTVINQYTVVSPEVAIEMAKGARLEAGSDIAVSITGYAGPEADEGREAGNAYIGYAYDDTVGAVELFTKRNDRAWNRNYFRLMMLKVVNEILDEIK